MAIGGSDFFIIRHATSGGAAALGNLYIIVAGSAGSMGRIKTVMVKRTSGKLVEAYPEQFSKNFDKNKESLNELAEIRSKKLRNTIAGYIVRLKQQGDELRPKARKKKTFPQRR